MSRQFLLFLACNGFAAGINFGSRFAFSAIAPFPLAVVFAYLCGMATAFALSRWIVFGASEGGWRGQAVRFALVNGVAIVQTVAVSLFLAEWVLPYLGWTWQSEAVAHAMGVVVPVVTSYLGHKYWSFGRA